MFAKNKVRYELPSSSVGCVSDRGVVREQNEDSVLERSSGDGRWRLLVVCDGMGGHHGGKIASSLAATTIDAKFFGNIGIVSPLDALRVSIEEANRAIWEVAHEKPELLGMGTTVAALVTDGMTAHIAHVGDSRVYRIRKSEIRRMTKDHSNVQRMVDAGMLTPDAAAAHPDSNVLYRCLGQNLSVEVEIKTCTLEKGDRFLLCSDGLHGLVEEKIIAAMAAMYSAKEAAGKLVELAKSRGGTDNVSVIVFHRLDGNKASGVFNPEKFRLTMDWLNHKAPETAKAHWSKVFVYLAAGATALGSLAAVFSYYKWRSMINLIDGAPAVIPVIIPRVPLEKGDFGNPIPQAGKEREMPSAENETEDLQPRAGIELRLQIGRDRSQSLSSDESRNEQSAAQAPGKARSNEDGPEKIESPRMPTKQQEPHTSTKKTNKAVRDTSSVVKETNKTNPGREKSDSEKTLNQSQKKEVKKSTEKKETTQPGAKSMIPQKNTEQGNGQ